MKACANCKTYKRADNCRRCAEIAMQRVSEYDAVMETPMNDARKVEKLFEVKNRPVADPDCGRGDGGDITR